MNNLEIVAVAVIPVCMVLMFALSKRDIKSFKMNFTFPIKFRFLYKGIIINHNKNRANLH